MMWPPSSPDVSRWSTVTLMTLSLMTMSGQTDRMQNVALAQVLLLNHSVWLHLVDPTYTQPHVARVP